MNKERRAEIEKATTLIEQAKDILESAGQDERDYFDNMPESFQSGERGQRADEAATALEEAITLLDDALAHAATAIE